MSLFTTRARKQRALPPLDALPDDALILILSSCQIDALFALRLTNKRICNTVSTYSASIIPAVARHTFPRNELLFRREKLETYSLRWLRGRIPQHLAAILVDRHRFAHTWAQGRYGIPAEDPYGQELRSRVANGWRVLQTLSAVAQHVYTLKPSTVWQSRKDLGLALVNRSRYRHAIFKSREELILKRRLEYIELLSDELARDYRLMFMLLSSAFRTSLSNVGEDYKPWIFDWGLGLDGPRLLRRGNSWLTWFVLHRGPSLFWQQWWALPSGDPRTKDYIRDQSLREWFGGDNVIPEDFAPDFPSRDWTDAHEKRHSLQRDYAYKVQRAIEEKAATGDFSAINPIIYFTRYAEYRELRFRQGIPAFTETLGHVPFYIDFRCPDELTERVSMLRSGSSRDASGMIRESTA